MVQKRPGLGSTALTSHVLHVLHVSADGARAALDQAGQRLPRHGDGRGRKRVAGPAPPAPTPLQAPTTTSFPFSPPSGTRGIRAAPAHAAGLHNPRATREGEDGAKDKV